MFLAIAALMVSCGSLSDDELDRHQGTWTVISFRFDGSDASPEVTGSIIRVVEKDHVVWKRDGKNFAGTTIVLKPALKPAGIDVIPDGGPDRGESQLGIYRLEDHRLTICMAGKGQPRPTEFKAEKGSRQTLMVLERSKANPPAKPPRG